NAKRAERVAKNQISKEGAASEEQELTEYSAGGVIIQDEKIVLIAKMSRNDKKEWTFPKGHIEKDEAPADAAVREVYEETGLQTHIVDRLGVSDYWFYAGNIRIHKFVYYFVMEVESGALEIKRNIEENIVDAKWTEYNKLLEILSYPTEKKLAKFAFDRMNL
ncbi:MAG: NUDIX hydrolase, partial [Bifidobacteriaceae bacterium]|nr:NUDIX hydrolase [Bifidobacteriaceae bacterium]